jgi:deoxyribodipyrimidine photo-lyase
MIVVWLKRDLRLLDHEPLVRAIASQQKVLLLFSFEPLWSKDSHYSQRHINFIKQSLVDLHRQLMPYGIKIMVVSEDILSVFNKIHASEEIQLLFSHQETGMKMTYERDKQVTRWCKQNGVIWQECIQNGVFRGIQNRQNWKKDWVSHINQLIPKTKIADGHFYSDMEVDELVQNGFSPVSLETETDKNMQQGGTHTAIKYLDSFLNNRISGYNTYYSKPTTSRLHSSRLSPYLAWGNLSTRQVCQYAAKHKEKINKRNLLIRA